MSNEQEPVAWAVGYGGSGGYFTDDERKADSWRDAGATVTPLYRHPQTMLTDAEREAIEVAAGDYLYHQDPGGRAQHIRQTLLGLLERTQ